MNATVTILASDRNKRPRMEIYRSPFVEGTVDLDSGKVKIIRIFDSPNGNDTEWFTFVGDCPAGHEAVYVRDPDGQLRETDALLISFKTEDGKEHIRQFGER